MKCFYPDLKIIALVHEMFLRKTRIVCQNLAFVHAEVNCGSHKNTEILYSARGQSVRLKHILGTKISFQL